MANLVAKTLGGNDGDFIAKTLVGLEVERQLRVVTLNDDLGGLLDGLLNPRKKAISLTHSQIIFPIKRFVPLCGRDPFWRFNDDCRDSWIPSAAGLEILFRNLVWAGAGLAPGYLLT